MSTRLAPLALLALSACALPPGLYTLSDADPRAPGTLSVGLLKDGNLTLLASAPHDVALAPSLAALGPAGVVYSLALVQNGGRDAMALATIDLATGNITGLQPTSLPVEELVGYGQQMDYMSDSGEILLQTDVSSGAPDENHTVIALNPKTGTTRNITQLPGNTVFDVLATMSGYSPKSHMYWTVVRNSTGGVRSLFVDTRSGAFYTAPMCFASSGGYDSVSDSFVGVAVYRNGTTIADVYWSVYSIPASGGPCTLTYIFASEGDDRLGSLVENSQAINAQARELTFFGSSGPEPTDPMYTYTINLDSGAWSRAKGTFLANQFPDALFYVPA